MNSGQNLERSIRQVLVIQAVATVVLLLLVTVYRVLAEKSGFESVTDALIATGYGSFLALVGTWLNARSVRRSSQVAEKDAHAAMVPVFSGLLNKLVLVGGGIAFGLVALKLEPILVVTSYMVVQLAAAWTMFRSEPGQSS